MEKQAKDRIFNLILAVAAIAGLMSLNNPIVCGVLAFVLIFSAVNLFF